MIIPREEARSNYTDKQWTNQADEAIFSRQTASSASHSSSSVPNIRRHDTYATSARSLSRTNLSAIAGTVREPEY